MNDSIAIVNLTGIIDGTQAIPLPELFLIVLAIWGILLIKIFRFLFIVFKWIDAKCCQKKNGRIMCCDSRSDEEK